MKTDAWHHRSDAITSTAAFIGISVALLGGPGWESADDWAALARLRDHRPQWLAAALCRPCRKPWIPPRPRELEETIRAAAAAVPGVIELDQCRIRKLGLDFYVDLHVGVDAELTVRAGHAIAHEVKDAIRQAKPEVADVLVHIEPADGK